VKKKVLVVDDSRSLRQMVVFTLQQAGYQVTEAGDGSEGLRRLRRDPFDLLITDWNMAGMDGIELLKAVRADANLCKLPVLMVTADGKRENILTAVQAGATGYIVKPFTAATLEDKMGKIFEMMAHTQ